MGTVDDGIDKLHPNGWLRQRLGQFVGGLDAPIANPAAAAKASNCSPTGVPNSRSKAPI